MESTFRTIGTLLIAAGCASIYPACLAQTLGKSAQGSSPATTVAYASAESAESGTSAAAAPAPAAAPATAPDPAAPATTVRTEVIPTAAISGAELRPALTKELEAMKQRIAELEAEIEASGAATADAATALQGEKEHLVTGEALQAASPAAALAQPAPAATTQATPDIDAEVTTKSAPFAYADWTWLNGNPRNKDTPMATKYFTPEFRADVNYILDFNHPKDDSMGGSTESFRSDEVQVEQLSFGGDIRINNVRGRFLTMYGMFATTTPRNDASPGRGQWDLADAYRYVSEAWGGYHWNVQHGLNLDAGIFVSYIGLFSYYNFDNWTYQPSYVSSNTPWFFNGVRAQWFPTDKLKIEPWFINGWQSYGRPNGKPGLGGQILYRPKPWVSLVFNNYGLGEDAVGISDRSRIHTDDSVEIKYYDRPERFIDKAAFTFTGDLGCEFGGGVSCTGKGGNPKQAFLGYMFYNRVWAKKDLYGLTIGGGQLNNPGRYLVLLPPIDGATAITGTPYYTENPGQPYHAYDLTATYDYMPSQFITFRAEMGYRHTDLPYWTGRGGITPPGGNNGSPGDFACATGSSSGTNVLAAAEVACGGGTNSVWFPDLRTGQIAATVAVMVKF
jgi:Putative beta-barrel porin-2, OmpL-like. bbp2